jgi:two-component system, NtrC family, response regulator HydG
LTDLFSGEKPVEGNHSDAGRGGGQVLGLGLHQLTPSPRRVALVVGRPSDDVTRVLERLGCEIVPAGVATAVESATAAGAVDVAVLDPTVLELEHGEHLVGDLRAAYPCIRLLLLADADALDPRVLVRAIRAGLHDVVDPGDTLGLRSWVERSLAELGEHAERVLAIGAHPDDVEIGCAGALLDHRRRGDHVTVLTLSRGDVGGDVDARMREAGDAARLVGARLLLADLPDTRVDPGIETIRLVESVVAEVAPTVVYVHSSHDNHQDHRAVHTATMSATRGVPQVFAYQSPSATNDFSPNRFVPIDGVVVRKVQVLASFASQSQRSYLEPELVIAGARYWARHLAPLARYAEPFEVIRSFVPAKPVTPALDRLTGAAAPVVPMPMMSAASR